MKLVIATPDDISLIQDMARRSWENAYAEILSSEQMEFMLGTMYSKEEILSQMQHPNYHYYLMKDENSNSFEGFIGYEYHYEEKTTKLHKIYLVPESKGKGFGKDALQFLIQQASDKGDTRIILNVNKYNSSKQFYESQGYRVYDEGVFDIGRGFFMDDYLMEYIIHK
ncbi:GNAT family N-acetyltransferase [Chryseobacterium sp. SSA4.19]|uniref:GNAT family N-acetyltransferase n=1 Tax=Chryseobacterium sp. SSA4.19 TaxID=2919915 RepID=UPI001F4EABB2|nr:GNAT family N-acetyltransferase [Chryseobacterium sp. SSA4.19]MCJ8153720.1 GNAT family N-acetyltransferase [Chryseobacterium sp. SSA4.19]